MLFSLLFLATTASGGTEVAIGVSGATGTIGQAGNVSGRVRWSSGLQLGARIEGSLARGWYIDGWEVREGTALAGVLSATLPLIGADTVRVDIEVDGGLRFLSASDTDAPSDRATVVLMDLAPMVTLPIGQAVAARVGWKQVTHLQVRPQSGLEAQGALLRAALVWAPNDDLQIGLGGATGGVFGFGGDGGKAIAQASAVFRWVPGAARTYTNH